MTICFSVQQERFFSDKPYLSVGWHFLKKVIQFTHKTKYSTDEEDILMKLPVHIVDKVFSFCQPLDIVQCWEVSATWQSYLFRHQCWRAIHSLLRIPSCWRVSQLRLWNSKCIYEHDCCAAVLTVPGERMRLLPTSSAALSSHITSPWLVDLLSVRLKEWLGVQDRWLQHAFKSSTFEHILHMTPSPPSPQWTLSAFAEHAHLCFLGVSSHVNGVLVVQFHPNFHYIDLLEPEITTLPHQFPLNDGDSPPAAGIWALTVLSCDINRGLIYPTSVNSSCPEHSTRCYVLAGDVRGNIHCWLVESRLPVTQDEEPTSLKVLWRRTLPKVHDRVVRSVANNYWDTFVSGGRDGRIFVFPLVDLVGLAHVRSTSFPSTASAPPRPYYEMRGHTLNTRVHRLGFISRKRFLSVGYDGCLCIWHVDSEMPLLHLDMHHSLYTFAATPMDTSCAPQGLQGTDLWLITLCAVPKTILLVLVDVPVDLPSPCDCLPRLVKTVCEFTAVPALIAVAHTKDAVFIGDSNGVIVHIVIIKPEKVINSIQAHSGTVTALQVNSTVLISCGYFPSLRIWNPHSLDLLYTVNGDYIPHPIRHLHVTESLLMAVGLSRDQVSCLKFWFMDYSTATEPEEERKSQSHLQTLV